jgi:LacI family transcriptional regulator
MLDRLFTAFDELDDRHEVEKIKTIGDCYMVAAGVPRPRPDHAHALGGRLALEMKECARTCLPESDLRLRIGISVGRAPPAAVTGRPRRSARRPAPLDVQDESCQARTRRLCWLTVPEKTLSYASPTVRPATMRDVAALAGVGLKTVSRVVNGESNVSQETRARVEAAIERLDYRQDINASLLRRLGRKTATIGLVLEDVSNPFSSALHRAIEDRARERGVLLFTGSCDEDPDRERELIGTFRARRVDGIVVVPASSDHRYLLPEQRARTPLVFVDRRARFVNADSVTSDNIGGAERAVAHLADAGHRRIGFLGDALEIETAAERLRGYDLAVAALELDSDPALVRTGLRSVDAAAQAGKELLRSANPPTALFTAQNLVTIGALHALRVLGLEHTTALVGFDDVELADLLEPAVTVVAQDPAALGRAAADLLFRRLDGEDSPPQHVVIDVELIVRGSGEIPAAA